MCAPCDIRYSHSKWRVVFKCIAVAVLVFSFAAYGSSSNSSSVAPRKLIAPKTLTVEKPEDLIFFDNFEYIVDRSDPNANRIFIEQGRWTGAKTMQSQSPGARGYLYTVNQIPGFNGTFPGNNSQRILAMEALPHTLRFQTDFFLQYGIGADPAYENAIPSNVWFQFWIYINHHGEQRSQIDAGKLIYPCDTAFPCRTNKWLLTFGSWSQPPRYKSLGNPSKKGAFLQHPASGSPIVNPSADPDNRWKFGQTNTSQFMAANRWTLVKIHLDTTTESAVYEAWMRPQGGTWTKVSEWIDGVSPRGFVWRNTPGGHRVIRMPTTIGHADPKRRSYDSWIYMDDFAMARTEAGLPTY